MNHPSTQQFNFRNEQGSNNYSNHAPSSVRPGEAFGINEANNRVELQPRRQMRAPIFQKSPFERTHGLQHNHPFQEQQNPNQSYQSQQNFHNYPVQSHPNQPFRQIVNQDLQKSTDSNSELYQQQVNIQNQFVDPNISLISQQQPGLDTLSMISQRQTHQQQQQYSNFSTKGEFILDEGYSNLLKTYEQSKLKIQLKLKHLQIYVKQDEQFYGSLMLINEKIELLKNNLIKSSKSTSKTEFTNISLSLIVSFKEQINELNDLRNQIQLNLNDIQEYINRFPKDQMDVYNNQENIQILFTSTEEQFQKNVQAVEDVIKNCQLFLEQGQEYRMIEEKTSLSDQIKKLNTDPILEMNSKVIAIKSSKGLNILLNEISELIELNSIILSGYTKSQSFVESLLNIQVQKLPELNQLFKKLTSDTQQYTSQQFKKESLGLLEKSVEIEIQSIRKKLSHLKKITKDSIKEQNAIHFLSLRNKIVDQILSKMNNQFVIEINDFHSNFLKFVKNQGEQQNNQNKITELGSFVAQLCESLISSGENSKRESKEGIIAQLQKLLLDIIQYRDNLNPPALIQNVTLNSTSSVVEDQKQLEYYISLVESTLEEQFVQINNIQLQREFEQKKSDLDLILSLSQNLISHYSHFDLLTLHDQPINSRKDAQIEVESMKQSLDKYQALLSQLKEANQMNEKDLTVKNKNLIFQSSQIISKSERNIQLNLLEDQVRFSSLNLNALRVILEASLLIDEFLKRESRFYTEIGSPIILQNLLYFEKKFQSELTEFENLVKQQVSFNKIEQSILCESERICEIIKNFNQIISIWKKNCEDAFSLVFIRRNNQTHEIPDNEILFIHENNFRLKWLGERLFADRKENLEEFSKQIDCFFENLIKYVLGFEKKQISPNQAEIIRLKLQENNYAEIFSNTNKMIELEQMVRYFEENNIKPKSGYSEKIGQLQIKFFDWVQTAHYLQTTYNIEDVSMEIKCKIIFENIINRNSNYESVVNIYKIGKIFNKHLQTCSVIKRIIEEKLKSTIDFYQFIRSKEYSQFVLIILSKLEQVDQFHKNRTQFIENAFENERSQEELERLAKKNKQLTVQKLYLSEDIQMFSLMKLFFNLLSQIHPLIITNDGSFLDDIFTFIKNRSLINQEAYLKYQLETINSLLKNEFIGLLSNLPNLSLIRSNNPNSIELSDSICLFKKFERVSEIQQLYSGASLKQWKSILQISYELIKTSGLSKSEVASNYNPVQQMNDTQKQFIQLFQEYLATRK